MTRSAVHELSAAVAALGEAWVGALPPFGAEPGVVSVVVGQMSDPGLLRVLAAAGALIKRAETLSAALAGEVARRSPREGPRSGNLARREGFSSPGEMVA
ncbi:MAG TPA: hypothetical protein VFC82_11605, partial [Actinomycetaceae bacterium]|nr:hypothetical protein [Actinomycetaceae bacterium]